MTMNTTYHARVERANRLRALEETLGFTKVVLQFEDVVEEKLYLLTSSGIIIVKSTRRDAIITAYMANVNQCYRLYKLAGKGQMSPKMEKRVKKNCERHPELFAVVGQKPTPQIKKITIDNFILKCYNYYRKIKRSCSNE